MDGERQSARQSTESRDELIQDLNECESEKTRLSAECLKLKKIIYILNEMNCLTQPVITNCECDSNCVNIINKLIVFKQKLEDLNTCDDTDVDSICSNNSINSFNGFDSNAIINTIIGLNKITPKLVLKSDKEFEEYGGNENEDNNTPAPPVVRRGRGRPPKKSYTVSKAAKIVSKSLTKPKPNRRLIHRNYGNNSNNSNNNNKNKKNETKIKGKVITTEGKEVFLSRTKRLQCQWPGCEAKFRDKEDMDNHLWRHTGEKAYQCDWPGCNKAFSSRCYLKKHHDTHIDPNVFKCLHEGCQEAYVTSLELNQHFNKSHDGEKPFKCCWPGCAQQFSVKRNLKDHQIVHIDEKKYRCDWPGCETAFKRKQQLDIHVCEVHQGEGRLRCDWPGCDSTFSSHNKLKIHKMRHTGEKPYKCQWSGCEWSFRQQNHLKAHWLKHTGEKPFHCEWPGCDRKFQTKQTMRFHYEKAHRLTQ